MEPAGVSILVEKIYVEKLLYIRQAIYLKNLYTDSLTGLTLNLGISPIKPIT